MRISLPKLKAIILYFCYNTDPKFLGKVKLMKLFYFLDFMSVKRYGIPITFDSYIKLEHGPIPSTIKNLIDNLGDDLDNSILSDIINLEIKPEMNIHRVVPAREFVEKDYGYLSETETELLQKVCQRFGKSPTLEIEQESHKESPWKDTQLLEEIPYSLAGRDSDSLFSEEEIQLMSQT